MMDSVLRLRELRRAKGLTQREVALRSGVGEKTISSFESGARIDSLKLSQLRRILVTYGMTEAEFFGGGVEAMVAPHELDETTKGVRAIGDLLVKLPPVSRPGAIQTCLGVLGIIAGASR